MTNDARRKMQDVGSKSILFLFLSIPLLTACGGRSDPLPTALPTATPSPLPTATPTPTPIPPVPLTVHWPPVVSALEDVTVRVELPGLAERDPEARLWASVVDPRPRFWWMAELDPAGEGSYVAAAPLHLPLEPMAGEWELRILIKTTAPITGERRIRFQPEPVPVRELTGVREGVSLLIPRAFLAARAEGDEVAGWRTWVGAGGEVGLGWTPGPAEALSLDTALMLVEASRSSGGPVEVLSAEPTEWEGLPAFRFVEQWSEGPAETLVVQGPDRWLYLLRVRMLNGESISPLLQEIAASFKLAP